MSYKERYLKKKNELLEDIKFNSKNKEIVKKFLEFQEYKLKRKEGLTEVDERSYKTLNFYVTRIRKLNEWFNNKDWTTLAEEDIRKLIDDLEDGILKNKYGKRYEDRSSFYQMLGGKFFSLAGKSHIAQQILEDFSIKGREFNKQVRFIEFESFKNISNCVNNITYLCVLWLAWDIGENIGTLLELEADDFVRQINPDTNEPEYLVILPKEKLKRSRTARSEITNYKETVEYLDIILKNLKPASKKTAHIYNKGRLFKFGMKTAEKFFRRAVEVSGMRCMPQGERVTWKDLRSSMACDLLNKGWSVDEVNARLGHSPSSRVIDRYINYLSLDRRRPKAKVYQGNLRKLEGELEKQKELNKLQLLRFENLKKEQEQMKEELKLFMLKTKSELQNTLGDVQRLTIIN